jgi:hypothetical protein
MKLARNGGDSYRWRGWNGQNAPSAVVTTLYELIETVTDSVDPGQEQIVTDIILDLSRRGWIRSVGQPSDLLRGLGL